MDNEKVALITGANKGIGFQIASELKDYGLQMIISALNQKRGKEALKKLSITNKELLIMNVGNPIGITEAYEQFRSKHRKIDVLVNNAGILLDENYSILNAPPNVSFQTLQTNALGLYG